MNDNLTEKLRHFMLVVILISTILNSCTNTSSYDEDNWARNVLNLNGKIKFVRYNSFDNNDSLLSYTSYRFDNLGRLIEKIDLNNGDTNREVYEFSKNKLTDQSIQITSVKQFDIFKNGFLTSRTNYTDSFDEKKQLVKQTIVRDGKNIRSTNLIYLPTGKLLSTSTLDLEGGDVIFEKFSYDDFSILREEIYLRKNKDSIQKRKIIREYDAKGKTTSVVSYFQNDFREKKENYFYNPSGKIIEYKLYVKDSLVQTECFVNYDSVGFKIDSIHKTYWWTPPPSKYELFQKEEYKFTKEEKIKECIIQRHDSFFSRTSYNYNKERKLTEVIVTYQGGKTIYKYDKMNNITMIQDFDMNDSKIKEVRIKMTYDAQNNIIRKTRSENDTMTENIRVRIEYY